MLSRCGIRHVTVASHRKDTRESRRRASSGRAKEDVVRGGCRDRADLPDAVFFEASPLLNWVKELRAQGLHSRVIAGLAGPAKLTTLLRYAARCGVGPSIRALGARPASFAALVGERGPEQILRVIACAMSAREIDSVGIHLYSFGGLSRTCSWVAHLESLRPR